MSNPQPLGGNEMPRFGGPATFMRLPGTSAPDDLDVAILGVPLDIGTTNRSGSRYGPRHIRAESCLIRPYNMATRAAPFDSLRIDDIGDVATNPFNLSASIAIIERHYASVIAQGPSIVAIGGDHTATLGMVRALAAKHGPMGMVFLDAHADVNDTQFGERVTHGTHVRRALEEGLLDPERLIQIGVRATGYAADDFDWPRSQGCRVVQVEECWHRSMQPLMQEVAEQMGSGPVYVSIDIDVLDPAYAPGTGTPEIGGLTSIQLLEIIRGLHGLNVVGADFMEVSPPYDPTGQTSLTAANLVFEMLCILPGVQRR